MDVTVVTSGHDVADARLHRLVGAMRRTGLSVEVLGLGSPADGPAGARTRAVPRPGLAGRAVLAVRYAASAQGRVLLALDPDAAVVLWGVARARRRRVVVDVHEDYDALLADRSWAHGMTRALARLVVRTATAVAARADLTLVADEHVPPLTARRRLVVTNEADRALLPSVEAFRPAAEPRAAYVGDVRASRGLFAMVETLRRSPAWHLDVVGPVATADRRTLDAAFAQDPDLARRVHVHGRRPPREAWDLVRGAWVGLALLDDTPAFRDAMPSKVLEYLACGIPVITTDLDRPAALVSGLGAGAVVPSGSVASVGAAVADVLARVLTDPSLLERWRVAAVGAARGDGPPGASYEAAAKAVHDLLPRHDPSHHHGGDT